MAEFEPLDPEFVKSTLSTPPFAQVQGVLNVGDLTYYLGPPKTASDDGVPTNSSRRKVLRSGNIAHITDLGKQQLRDYGIRKVYDLRSEFEHKKFHAPMVEVEGIEIIRLPIFKEEAFSPEAVQEFYALMAKGTVEGFLQNYTEILESGGPVFATVFKQIRDSPDEGFLFHCTAVKDRTGLVSMMILQLAGVDLKVIGEDYAATRVGVEPARDLFMKSLEKDHLQGNRQGVI